MIRRSKLIRFRMNKMTSQKLPSSMIRRSRSKKYKRSRHPRQDLKSHLGNKAVADLKAPVARLKVNLKIHKTRKKRLQSINTSALPQSSQTLKAKTTITPSVNSKLCRKYPNLWPLKTTRFSTRAHRRLTQPTYSARSGQPTFRKRSLTNHKV